MRLITRNTDYAVRALVFMAKDEERIIPVTELVQKLKIPKSFLRKILQILHKGRVLTSYRGQGGGFQLALTPEKIFLLDLVEIFQGPLKINECLFKKRLCPDVMSCMLKKKIDDIERYVVLEFKNITIASLLNGRQKNAKGTT